MSATRRTAVAAAQDPLGLVRARRAHTPLRNWLRRQAGLGTAAVALLFLFTTGAGQQAHAQTFQSLYSFSGGSDGMNPYGAVIEDSAGNVYGAVPFGGIDGVGILFKIPSGGGFNVCYNFGSQSADGNTPVAGPIIDAAGNLVGTTYAGGSIGLGTVYRVAPCTVEQVVHTFTGNPDGSTAYGGLVADASGNLYGTTVSGGLGYGTIFEINASTGAETVLYSFKGPAGDGSNPYAGLVLDAAGNLYGTTVNGGTNNDGTVFEFNATSGVETVLYSFTGVSDGQHPYSALVMDSSGNLYGTTSASGPRSGGTVFEINPAAPGQIDTLYAFAGGSDGAYPQAGLVMDASGNLYGTTANGGSAGDGTVFEIQHSGSSATETVLYTFTGNDGANPFAPLYLDSSYHLFGTTQLGGASGKGTVFEITLPHQTTFPFAAFSVKLKAASGPPPGFALQAFLTTASGGGAIDPVTQGVSLGIGSYAVTIEPGSFHQTSQGWWVYSGVINGVSLNVRISQVSSTTLQAKGNQTIQNVTGSNSYEVQVSASRVDITTSSNPATVSLTLGTNVGSVQAYY